MAISITFVLRALWTLIGLFGLLFTAGETRECLKDMAAVRRARDYVAGSNLEISAAQNRRIMVNRLILFSGFTALGVFALLSPIPNRSPTPLSLAFSLTFIAVELLMAYGAWLDRRDRARLLKKVRDRKGRLERSTDRVGGKE